MKFGLIGLSTILIGACAGPVSSAQTWRDNYGAERSAAIAADARAYFIQRQACDHFRGEPADDSKRRAFLNDKIEESCTGVDAERLRLMSKYADQKETIDALREFEACIEAASACDAQNMITDKEENQHMFKVLDDNISVSPQITLAQVREAKAQGFTTIINNRPDGEDPSAPQSSDIEAAARAEGMDYIAIPITHSGFSAPQIDEMVTALGKNDNKILAYCRSGTRSTLLWSLAQAKNGLAPDEIARHAGNAGYDITPVRAMIDALAGGS